MVDLEARVEASMVEDMVVEKAVSTVVQERMEDLMVEKVDRTFLGNAAV